MLRSVIAALCEIMKYIIIILSIFVSSFCHSSTFDEAEAGLNAMAPMQDGRSKDFMEAEGKAINGAWQQTGPCFKLGIKDKTALILQVSQQGQITNIWANKDHAKSICLKTIVSASKFPVPPYQPYYIKVTM